MEIIFNNNQCDAITGRIRQHCPWYIRGRKGHYHAAYRGPRNTDIKKAWFRVFVTDLQRLQDAKYISELVLTNEERRWLNE